MKLFLVQHGKAKDKQVDPDRPLTEEGRHETQLIAGLAARLDLNISEIRHSGKTRARETAELFGRALTPDQVVEAPGLHPTDDVKPVAEGVQRLTQPVMLVGHKPFMPRLAGQLVAGDPEQEVVDFQKSGVVCLSNEDGGWHVEWALTPG